MKLMHFSNAKTITVESRSQDRSHYKPRGFWVSDESAEDGWSTWCRNESFGIGRNAFSIELAPDVRLLSLTTDWDVRLFDQDFAAGDGYYIDWPRVAQYHQGILITPYQWTLRLSDVRWYYPWDCASGCIWDANAITEVQLVAEAVTS